MTDPMTMKIQAAEGLHLQGFNCSQAVFSTLGESLGLDRATASRSPAIWRWDRSQRRNLRSGYGGFDGAGYQEGFSEPDRRLRIGFIPGRREFLHRFQERYGALACKVLIGVDLSTPRVCTRPASKPYFQRNVTTSLAGR